MTRHDDQNAASRAGQGAQTRRVVFTVTVMQIELALADPRWSIPASDLLELAAEVIDAGGTAAYGCGACGQPWSSWEPVAAFARIDILKGQSVGGITSICDGCSSSGAVYRLISERV